MSTENENIEEGKDWKLNEKILLLPLQLDLYCLSHVKPKAFLTSFSNCFLCLCSSLHFEMFINSLNTECKL